MKFLKLFVSDSLYFILFWLRNFSSHANNFPVQNKTAVIVYNEGWCITGAVQDIVTHWRGDYELCTIENIVDDAEYYFVAYYTMLPRLYLKYPWLTKRKVIVKMAHAFDALGEDHAPRFSGRIFGFLLNQCHLIFNQASLWERHIIEHWGVNPNLIYTNYDGVDTTMFKGHNRTGQGRILVSTGCYPRKRPELLYAVAQSIPQREFLILAGSGWTESTYYTKLSNLKNVEFIHVSYKEYPKYYRQCDVYLSVSILEGGPIPLVESMAENIVPVVSRTGMADDLVCHGENGFMFELNDKSEVIVEYIKQAYALKGNIRKDVLHLDWELYSERLQNKIGIKKTT